jgi:hypothetical protein
VKQTTGAPVSEVRFHADTPEELIEAVRAVRLAGIG